MVTTRSQYTKVNNVNNPYPRYIKYNRKPHRNRSNNGEIKSKNMLKEEIEALRKENDKLRAAVVEYAQKEHAHFLEELARTPPCNHAECNLDVGSDVVSSDESARRSFNFII